VCLGSLLLACTKGSRVWLGWHALGVPVLRGLLVRGLLLLGGHGVALGGLCLGMLLLLLLHVHLLLVRCIPLWLLCTPPCLGILHGGVLLRKVRHVRCVLLLRLRRVC